MRTDAKRDIEAAARLAYGSCSTVECPYEERFCPSYWRRAFILAFRAEPEGHEDRRWDELFRYGFTIRDTFQQAEDIQQAAS